MVIINIGDLIATSRKGKLLTDKPLDNESANWTAKVELLDGLNAPFIKEFYGADSVQALYFALQYAGRYMTSIYGPAEIYKDVLPNYGFPLFTE